MKTIVSSKLFASSVDRVSLVIGKCIIPVTDYIKIEVKSGIMQITATDLDNEVTEMLQVEDQGDFSFLVEAVRIKSILKGVKDCPLVIELTEKQLPIDPDKPDKPAKIELFVTFQVGAINFNLPALDIDEFPKPARIEEGSKFQINAADLKTGLLKCIPFTGTDALREVMTGVYVEVNQTGIRTTATDAHKLVRYNSPGFERSDEMAGHILNKKTATVLSKSLENGPVYCESDGVTLVLNYGFMTVASHLIFGQYPRVDWVIPTDLNITAQVNRLELLNVLKSAPVSRVTKQVNFSINGKFDIWCNDIDFGTEFKTAIDHVHTGDDITIGFNRDFLVSVLKNTVNPQVQLQMSAPNRAVLIDSDPGVLSLIMPVLIKG